KCVDARLDSLEPTPPDAGYLATRIGPPILDSAPALLAVSDDFNLQDGCNQTRYQTAAMSWVADGGLSKMVLARYPVVLAADAGVLADGGSLCSAETFDLTA